MITTCFIITTCFSIYNICSRFRVKLYSSFSCLGTAQAASPSPNSKWYLSQSSPSAPLSLCPSLHKCEHHTREVLVTGAQCRMQQDWLLTSKGAEQSDYISQVLPCLNTQYSNLERVCYSVSALLSCIYILFNSPLYGQIVHARCTCMYMWNWQ